jgi:hypothetical protein
VGVGFATGVTAGATVAVEASDALAVGALVVFGEIGVVGFILADDGKVEGIA